MPTVSDLQPRLVRILRAETADHFGLDVAVEASAEELARIVWADDRRPDKYDADRWADQVEDWLGYHGHSLPLGLRKGWRETCRWALGKARIECL